MGERIRYMRLIVFFDLPTESSVQRRQYARFRSYLVKNGYLMMQKSVYSKLAIDGKMADALVARLAENKPPEGLVQVLQVTEKQFASIKYIAGHRGAREEIDGTEGLVVL